MNETELKAMMKQVAKDAIKEFMAQRGGSTGSFSVPLHNHNGSDAPRIQMHNILYDGQGLFFPLKDDTIRIYSDVNVFTPNNFIVTPTNNALTDFIVGYGTSIFNDINLQAKRVISTAFDITSGINTFAVLPLSAQFVASSAITSDGWYLRLPNNTVSLPASPQPGDIAVLNGILNVCESAGVWTPK